MLPAPESVHDRHTEGRVRIVQKISSSLSKAQAFVRRLTLETNERVTAHFQFTAGAGPSFVRGAAHSGINYAAA